MNASGIIRPSFTKADPRCLTTGGIPTSPTRKEPRMNGLGSVGIALICMGLLGMAIIGLSGLIESYTLQFLSLAGITLLGGSLLYLAFLFPGERPRRGM